METLTPIQRIAVITIGLTLTAFIAVFVFPWAGEQIAARMPPAATPPPATHTPLPTAAPAEQAAPSPTPTVALTPPPEFALLEQIPHDSQAAGDNALASLSMALQYWGMQDTQEAIASSLRPGGQQDPSIEMAELAGYARSRGMLAYEGINGNIQVLRQLVANGFPVIIARWYTTTEGIETWQYQVVHGYDHPAEMLVLHDASAGPGIAVSYSDADSAWQALHRPYLTLLPAEQMARAQAILETDEGEPSMWDRALARAERELDADAESTFAWLNKASALVALGRSAEAGEAFDRAEEIGLPAGLMEYRLEYDEYLLDMQEYDHLLTLTQAAADGGTSQEQIYLLRAEAYIALGDAAKARAEYGRALQVRPGWSPAANGLSGLPE